jgi:UbiD family decarboxylase
MQAGRHINTYAGIVNKDPDTAVQNVGIYRGMVGTMLEIFTDRLPAGSSLRANRRKTAYRRQQRHMFAFWIGVHRSPSSPVGIDGI